MSETVKTATLKIFLDSCCHNLNKRLKLKSTGSENQPFISSAKLTVYFYQGSGINFDTKLSLNHWLGTSYKLLQHD